MPNDDSEASALADERPYGAIPYWKVCVRCLHPLRVIRMRSLQGPFADNEFVEAAMDTHRKSAASDTIDDRCAALWKIERIGFSYCRHGSGTLHRPSMPAEILPISHTGLGIAAVEEAGLLPGKIRESIDSRAHPDFRHFAYESVGCAWGVYENRSFRRLFETFTGVRFPSCDLPDSGKFIAGFPAGFRPLLSTWIRPHSIFRPPYPCGEHTRSSSRHVARHRRGGSRHRIRVRHDQLRRSPPSAGCPP